MTALTWTIHIFDGINHKVLYHEGWMADVYVSSPDNLWSWVVKDIETKTIHPRGFGLEGSWEVATQKAETLVLNLVKESKEVQGKDLLRRLKIAKIARTLW